MLSDELFIVNSRPSSSNGNSQALLNRFRNRIAQSARAVAQRGERLINSNTAISRVLGNRSAQKVATPVYIPVEAENLVVHGRMAVYIDGVKFKRFIHAAYQWLRQQEAIINSYNVYPVPDGDTGTNMMHTMRSAWESIADVTEPNIGATIHTIANGAIRGSRGNSGIILSQIWRGFARSMDNKPRITAEDIAIGLREAAKTAYAGVNNPVEGTMLTVAREVADAAETAVKQSNDLRYLLDVTTAAAFESVQRTPELLKILKEAGVVDSGGYGLYVILDGMRRFANGEAVDSGAPHTTPIALYASPAHEAGADWGYDVQYLIYALNNEKLDVDAIRKDITAMGDCPLVLGDEAMVKVHVHVPDPGFALSYGVKLGSLRDVVVEDMQAQSAAFMPGQLRQDNQPLSQVELAIVAVASGQGIMRAFKDVGARAVVLGGQTMNPSVDDLLKAINDARANHVILLPNNANIIMTAQQAAQLSEVPVDVLPTRTIPQGIAAAIAFNFERDAQGNVNSMSLASQQVTTLEVTTSTRTVTVNGVSAQEGQIIGLIDDKLVLASSDVQSAVIDLLQISNTHECELVTLYFGNTILKADAEKITHEIRALYPSLIVDLYEGQQPHYHFIIGVE